MPRLRVLKVIVQPVYVVDDGDTLTERPGAQVVLSADEIEGFPALFAAGFEQLRQQVEGNDQTEP